MSAFFDTMAMEAVTLEAPAVGGGLQAVDPLVEGLRRGLPEAIALAYDQHQGAVIGLARRLVGDADVALDLAHEVFMTLPRAIQGYAGRSSLRTFLLGIVVRQAQHHIRGAARRRAAMERLGREAPGRPPTPEQEALRRDLSRALVRALDTLSHDLRATFVLCEVEERSSPEVAEILGIPEATVRTRLHHGRRKLQEFLTREGLQ